MRERVAAEVDEFSKVPTDANQYRIEVAGDEAKEVAEIVGDAELAVRIGEFDRAARLCRLAIERSEFIATLK